MTQEQVGGIPSVTNHSYCIMRCNRWGTYVRWLEYSGIFACGPKPLKASWGPLILDRNVPRSWVDPRELCPVDAIEALETDRAVRRLPSDLCYILSVEHISFSSQQAKAELLNMSRTTYWRRCGEAYGLLLGLMNDVAVDRV